MMRTWLLTNTSKDALGVFIGFILRPKTKWIQEKFNGLSEEAWVKNVQICQAGPLSTLWVIFEATGEV
jgi:hypothetical protein